MKECTPLSLSLGPDATSQTCLNLKYKLFKTKQRKVYKMNLSLSCLVTLAKKKSTYFNNI